MSCGHEWTRAAAGGEVYLIGFGVMALRYASWGYAVIPCERGGKKPHRMLPPEGGVHWASRNADRIREWWSDDPWASIGIATGQASALAVIDLDVKNGHDGVTAFATDAPAGLYGYPVAQTPSGGYHIWLRTPAWAAVPERPGILPGVDVKGDGGLVIAPPSARLVMPLGLDGERVEPVPVPYEWDQRTGCPCSAPMAPDWLPGWLASAKAGTGGGTRGEPPDVAELRETGVPVGERNRKLHKLACSLFRKCGTGPKGSSVVVEAVTAVWGKSDTAGLPWNEVMVLIESARKYISSQQEQERASSSGYEAYSKAQVPDWAVRRNP